jgi:hypothetical protein
MSFQTRGGTPPRRRHPSLPWLVLFGAVIALLVAVAGAWASGVFTGPPSTVDIVAAFKDEGLPVGNSYPVEDLDGWTRSPIPKTYEQGTHFDIPGQGKQHGGQVFVYESREDLQVMRRYYEQIEKLPTFGPSLHSHLYQEGLVLLQVNGGVPKTDADRYGDVMQREV